MELLLGLGATHKECNRSRTPLWVAISKHNEDMALRLLQHFSSMDDKLLQGTELKEASYSKLPRVVQDILKRTKPNIEQAQLDNSLFHVLRQSYSEKDTLQIAEMLLRAGANPGKELAWQGGSVIYAAREHAARWYAESLKAKALFYEGPKSRYAHKWRV
jgi:hypothetical protein